MNKFLDKIKVFKKKTKKPKKLNRTWDSQLSEIRKRRGSQRDRKGVTSEVEATRE